MSLVYSKKHNATPDSILVCSVFVRYNILIPFKDFETWCSYKRFLDEQPRQMHARERQVWWIACGQNIGDEENGKGSRSLRPVVVMKVFNTHLFWGLALSSRAKFGPYYTPLKLKDGFKSNVMLSQMRAYDAKRLIDYVGTMPVSDWQKLRLEVKALL